MSLIKNTVLLLKSERSDSDSDKYENYLKLHNFEVIQVKTLVFNYKHIDVLREKLLNPDDFSGIIFSSPRCVNAAEQALCRENVQKLWGQKSNFSVGATSCHEALDRLGLQCHGKECGNAKNLSQFIIQERSTYSKPFLFPHGNLKTDTFKLELGKDGLDIEGVLVYDTLPNPNIAQQLCNATNGYTMMPEFVVFFSPSGFHSSLEHLKKVPISLDKIKIIAIGPVTELAIKESNLHVYSVAKNPTPEEVLNSILN